MSEIMVAHTYDTVAYIEGADTSVYFSPPKSSSYGHATAVPVQEMVTTLNIVPWGEDNRFPQNIVHQLGWSGPSKQALNTKASELWASGIVPVQVVGYEKEGIVERVQILYRIKYKRVYDFIENPLFKHSTSGSYRIGSGSATASPN